MRMRSIYKWTTEPERYPAWNQLSEVERLVILERLRDEWRKSCAR